MTYRDDLRVLRAWCRKAEGREAKSAPANSLQGRHKANAEKHAKRIAALKRVLEWQRRHKKKWAAYMRKWRRKNRQQTKHLSGTEGKNVNNAAQGVGHHAET